MALSETFFIVRAPGRVPEVKRCVHDQEMSFLAELLRARPGEIVTVVIPDAVHGPMVSDGPEQLEIWHGRYRHLARRHRASTRAAFRAPNN